MQPSLHEGEGEVGAGSFEHGPQGVGGAAQPARERVGKVDGDEQVVHRVHLAEQALGFRQLAGAQAVEQVAAQLRGRLGKAVQPGRQRHAHVGGAGQRPAVDESSRQDRLGVLLLGVVQETGEGDRRVGTDGRLGFGERGRGVAAQAPRLAGLVAVDGPDRQAGVADRAAAGGQAALAGVVGSGERREDGVGEPGQLAAALGSAQFADRRE